MTETPTYEVLSTEAGGVLVENELRLRLEQPSEEARAALTDDSRTLVPWPFERYKMLNLYNASPWLGAVGNLLADAVASAEWDLASREADTEGNTVGRQEAKKDPDYERAYAWLARPDVGRDGISTLGLSTLLRSMVGTFDRTGNIFVEVTRTRAGDEPAQLVRLLPQFLWYETKGGTFGLTQLDPFRGEATFLPFGTRKRGEARTEFLHYREPNDVSSFYGIPAWHHAIDSVEVDAEHRKYLKGFFKNHGTPRWLFKVRVDPEWLSAGQVPPQPAEVTKAYQFIVNFLNANKGNMAGRNLVVNLGGGIVVEGEQLDHKIEDPTFPNTAQATRDEILAVRHVSLLNLGFGEDSNRATSQQQSENFRKEVLEPFAAPAVWMVNKVLHAPKPFGLGVENWDFRLRFQRVGELLEMIEALVKAAGGPIWSRNEARQLSGFEKIQGADGLLEPVNMVPGMGFNGEPDQG